MAGLALGSFWGGRLVDRRPRVLPLYALLEAAIGVSAVALPVALAAVTPVYVWSHRHLSDAFWVFGAMRFVLAFALLCVPTALMGATLPALSRYMVRNTGTLGRRVGALYALNTGGAVVGCFAAGYVLLGRYGLTRTVWIGAALNLTIAVIVWIGQRWAPAEPRATETPPTLQDDEAPAPAVPEWMVRRVLVCFA